MEGSGFKIMSQSFVRATQENHEISELRKSVSPLRFEPGASRIQVTGVAA
jgi:hypothetical protein